MIGTLFVGQQLHAPDAHALDLPTWEDVQAAKANEARTAEKITEIQNLLVEVRSEVAQRQREAEVAAAEAEAAEQRFQEADMRAQSLEQQAEESRQVAQESSEQAAALVSQMYRSGGVDRNLELFLDADPDSADTLLDRMAMMSKSTERNTKLSDEATQAMNTANSLGDQAREAREERERLYQEAEQAMAAAAVAVEEAHTRQVQAEENQRVLEVQLEALEDETAETVAGYQERLRIEEERRRQEEERRRREAEAAARRAAEEAARQAAAREAAAAQAQQQATPPRGSGGGGGGSSSGGGGVSAAPTNPVSSGAWGNPLIPGTYRISCNFYCYGGHRGIDLAAPTGTGIYAASSGRVTYSGWRNSWGFGVDISHGGGVLTRYAHMVSHPVVRNGQYVERGQLIGYVGSTGNSTGPHLHLETIVYGGLQNPAVFMSQRGVRL